MQDIFPASLGISRISFCLIQLKYCYQWSSPILLLKIELKDRTTSVSGFITTSSGDTRRGEASSIRGAGSIWGAGSSRGARGGLGPLKKSLVSFLALKYFPTVKLVGPPTISSFKSSSDIMLSTSQSISLARENTWMLKRLGLSNLIQVGVAFNKKELRYSMVTCYTYPKIISRLGLRALELGWGWVPSIGVEYDRLE